MCTLPVKQNITRVVPILHSGSGDVMEAEMLHKVSKIKMFLLVFGYKHLDFFISVEWNIWGTFSN